MQSSLVVDTDAHFIDPLDEVAEYLDEDDPLRSKFSINENMGARLWPATTGDRNRDGLLQRPPGHKEEISSREQITEIMEWLGVDKTVFLSQKMLVYHLIKASDRRPVAFANGYMDYLLDQIVDPSREIYGMIPAPYHDPIEAAKLIERTGDHPGIIAVCLVSAAVEPPFGNEKYDPIYEAAQNNDLPIVFHGSAAGLDQFYLSGFKSFIETHTLGFMMYNISQLVSVVIEGVPERFPDLDFVFQESGIAWVPGIMHRLDGEYLKRQSEAPLLNKRPSKYMRDFYYGTQPLDEPEDINDLQPIIQQIGGADQLMYASDYPHWDYDPPSAITSLPFLSSEEKSKILGENALEVFNL